MDSPHQTMANQQLHLHILLDAQRHVPAVVPAGDRLARGRHGPLQPDQLLHGHEVPSCEIHPGGHHVGQLFPGRDRRGLRWTFGPENRPHQHHGLYARAVLRGRLDLPAAFVPVAHGRPVTPAHRTQ